MDSDIAPGQITPGFTAAERAYVRRELDQFLSSLPKVADGLLLKTWKTGPQKGEVKLSPVAESLVERGLAVVGQAGPWKRLFFTEPGLQALRHMLSDSKRGKTRALKHVRCELGIEGDS